VILAFFLVIFAAFAIICHKTRSPRGVYGNQMKPGSRFILFSLIFLAGFLPAVNLDVSAGSRVLAAGITLHLPFSLARFCIFFISILLFLYIVDWVNRDAEFIGTNKEYWNMLTTSGLVAYFALTYIIPVTLLGAALGVAIFLTVFCWYVSIRNKLVPDKQRVFTPYHLELVFRRTLNNIGISVGAPHEEVVEKEDKLEVTLLRKDGQVADGSVSEAEAIVALKDLFAEAVMSRATDIHLEPKGADVHVRLRVDGVLQNTKPLPAQLGQYVISTIKVISEMDIAEKRRPQDGDMSIRIQNRDVDVRTSTSISVYGEKMVLRLLDKSTALLDMENLGLNQSNMIKLRRSIKKTSGMLLISGPTGSGKTTTLYAMLNELDAFQSNIVTIEDPIEYRLHNITQTAINEKAGVTFASSIKHLLRQDPDIIMVGEIRDVDTAHTALEAATTGHFVFSTVHANDSIASIFRILDLGIEPYLVSVGVSTVMAQRLVRVLCNNCKIPYKPQAEFVEKAGLDSQKVSVFYKAVGCEMCRGTGYFGRTAIYEVCDLDESMREMIRTGAGYGELRKHARSKGMRSMQEDGMHKVTQGITSIKELARITK